MKNGKITEEVANSVQVFIRDNQTQLPALKPDIEVKPVTIPIRQRFQTILKEKKSNLCLSADLTSLDEIIEVKFVDKERIFFVTKFFCFQLAKQVGSNICMLKIHCDILTDFSMDKIHQLKDIARKFNFLLLEDR